MKLHIIYRITDREDGVMRPLGMTKKQTIGCTLSSLVKSIDTLGDAWHISIVHDGLSSEVEEFVKETASRAVTAAASPHRLLDAQQKMLQFADATGDTEDTWLYFCDDEHLHDYRSFLPKFLDFVAFAKNKNFALPVFYTPVDDIELYQSKTSRSYIFETVTGYIREVPSCGSVFLCQFKTYKKFSHVIMQVQGIFKREALCFSPLPGTASQMIEGKMGRYVDWEGIVYNRV